MTFGNPWVFLLFIPLVLLVLYHFRSQKTGQIGYSDTKLWQGLGGNDRILVHLGPVLRFWPSDF